MRRGLHYLRILPQFLVKFLNFDIIIYYAVTTWYLEKRTQSISKCCLHMLVSNTFIIVMIHKTNCQCSDDLTSIPIISGRENLFKHLWSIFPLYILLHILRLYYISINVKIEELIESGQCNGNGLYNGGIVVSPGIPHLVCRTFSPQQHNEN